MLAVTRKVPSRLTEELYANRQKSSQGNSSGEDTGAIHSNIDMAEFALDLWPWQ
jgi:hypothetical protein